MATLQPKCLFIETADSLPILKAICACKTHEELAFNMEIN